MGKRVSLGFVVTVLLVLIAFPLTALAAPAPTPTPYTWVAVTSSADLTLDNIKGLCALGAPDLTLSELRQANLGVTTIRAGTAFNVPSCCASTYGVFTKVRTSSAPSQAAPTKAIPPTPTQPAAPTQAIQQNVQAARAVATPVAVAVTLQSPPAQASVGAGINLDSIKEFLAQSTQFGDYSVPNWLLAAGILGTVVWLFKR
jgi:hypothetical protein